MKLHTLCLTAAIAFLSPSSASAGETLYGVNIFNELLSFDSEAPGTILATKAITGLQSFESVAAIDFRPSTGGLYALGNAPGSVHHLYSINLETGAATQVGGDLSLGGATAFGFDFDPIRDTIRVVSNLGLNGRIDPATGAYTADTTIRWVGTGEVPKVVGIAYASNVAGTVSSILYALALQSVPDTTFQYFDLLIQSPPNGGLLTFANWTPPFINEITNLAGFDISGATGDLWVSAGYPGESDSRLYRLKFTFENGEVGLSTEDVGEIGSGQVLRGISVGPAAAVAPEPELAILSLSRATGTFSVTVAGQAGRKYELQRSLTLGSTSWTGVATLGPLAADDAALELTDPSAPAEKAFYRVVRTKP